MKLTLREYFLRVFSHSAWGNRRSYQAIARHSPPDARASGYLSHIVAAERVWIARLKGLDSSSLPIWPELTLEDCERVIDENAAAIGQYLAELNDEVLESAITYRNSKGAEFTTPVIEVLTHLAMHGTYHRGQIASALRNAGLEPENTDFITFVRDFPA